MSASGGVPAKHYVDYMFTLHAGFVRANDKNDFCIIEADNAERISPRLTERAKHFCITYDLSFGKSKAFFTVASPTFFELLIAAERLRAEFPESSRDLLRTI